MVEFTRANIGNAGYGNNELILLSEVTYQSPSENYSNVHIQAILRCPVYVSTSATYLSIQGGARYKIGSYWSAGDHVVYDNTIRVGHNPDGTVSYNFSATISSTYLLSGTASGIVPIGAIPRYANITSFSVSKVDETSVKYNWSADANCDYAWYSTNNGASWADLPPSNIIGGLSANTSYNFKLKVRRADSQLTTDSGTYTQSTYDYPHCTISPDFVIGNSLTLSFYNPLSRNISITGIGANNTTIFTGSTSGTSASGFNSAEEIETQYNSIPNTTNSTYKVEVVYGNITKTRNNGNTYSINVNESKPAFEDFNYSTDLSELTGNNDTVINGKTSTTITVSTTNKATAKNGASMVSYLFSCGGVNEYEEEYSSLDDVTHIIQNCISNFITVTAVDSRGLQTKITKTVANFKNYFEPTFVSYNVDRQNGVEEITYLDMKFNFWNYNFGSQNNIIKSLKYRIKQTGTTAWSEWYSIDETQLSINEEEATLTDYLIHENGISGGFTIGNQYDIQLQIIDGANNISLSTIESGTFILTDGVVAFSVSKDNDGEYHIGINDMPDNDYTININGNVNAKGLYLNGSKINSYSTTEKIIGFWIDDKPIYQIVSSSLPSNIDIKITEKQVTSNLYIYEYTKTTD